MPRPPAFTCPPRGEDGPARAAGAARWGVERWLAPLRRAADSALELRLPLRVHLAGCRIERAPEWLDLAQAGLLFGRVAWLLGHPTNLLRILASPPCGEDVPARVA